MVRAARCKSFGKNIRLVVEDVNLPRPAPNTVQVAIKAAGVNFADVLMRTGKYQETPELPFTPGIESAGIVEEVGTGVTSVKAGDRVMVRHAIPGAFATAANVAATDVMKIPDELDFEQAAALQVTFGSAHVALKMAAARANETILINAAAGGVGSTAVAVAREMGLTVIGTAGGAHKTALVEKMGATAIDYNTEDVRSRVKELTNGDGVHMVYDPVGGDLFNTCLRCTRQGGRLLVIGFASGDVQQIPANILLVKNLTVHGFYFGGMGRLDPSMVSTSLNELAFWAVQGRIDARPSKVYDLADVNQALDDLAERRSTGKLVIRLPDAD